MRIVGNPPSGGKKPTTPTIGTATDGGTGTTVSVAFTPSTYIGKGTITYTATSSPGSLTGTGSGSPITVSGLTTGTAYTFTVNGTTNYGVASDSSAASNSVTPASPSSFDSIATVTASGSVASLTISSIPQTYKHLQIRFIYKDSSTTDYGVTAYVPITINGSSANFNAAHFLVGNGSAVSATNDTAPGSMAIQGAYMSSNATYANMFGVGIVDILDYTSTTKYKTWRAIAGDDANGNGVAKGIALSSGVWAVTSGSTLNSITLLNYASGLASGTTFALYGIKG